MSASGKFAKLPHFLQFVPTHFRTPSFRAVSIQSEVAKYTPVRHNLRP
jgi:hypothetical protein